MLGKRLAASRERAGLNQTQLAAELGPRYDQAMVSRVESGLKHMRFDGIIRAANVLQVSIDYLAGLTDDPEPAARLAETLRRERSGATELEDDEAVAATEHDTPRHHLFAGPGITPVRLLRNASIAAGAAGHADEEHVLSYVPFRDDWLRSHNLNSAQCAVVEVIGQSMEPTLEHHSVILVDFKRRTRRPNRVFAIRDADGPVVKRLRYDKDGRWWLDSDNEEASEGTGRRIYPPRPWPEDAGVIGQVMWTGRTL